MEKLFFALVSVNYLSRLDVVPEYWQVEKEPRDLEKNSLRDIEAFAIAEQKSFWSNKGTSQVS